MLLSQHMIQRSSQDSASGACPFGSLSELDLRSNNIRRAGAMAIGNMLSCPSILGVIKLGGNMLGKDGGNAIAKGMLSNASVTHLDVRDCGMDEEAVGALLKAAVKHPRLKSLMLSKNTCEGSIEDMVRAS